MRVLISFSLLLLSFPISAAAPQIRIWEVMADFDGGASYAIDINVPIPGGPVALRPDFRYDYGQDPLEIAPSTFYWTKSNLAVMKTFLPDNAPGGLATSEPALVSVGNFIYVIGGCNGGGVDAQTRAEVWFCEVAGGAMQNWQKASWEFGQTQNDTKGIPIYQTRALAVGNRIYVAGGSTKNCNSLPVFLNSSEATDAVYSAPVNPATHDVGPWVKEPTLIRTVVSPGLVYAGGALITIGGREFIKGSGMWFSHQWVQKSEIKPDGHLSNWVALRSAPPGYPPPSCASNPFVHGWEQVGSFSVGRTIGFLGGMLTNSTIDYCTYYLHGYYAYLDENNQIAEWVGLISDVGKGRPGSYPQVYNGSIISAGGGKQAAATQDVIHNPSGGGFGVERDISHGYDGTDLRPNYGKLDPEDSTSQYKFTVPAFPAPAVMVQNRIFIIGLKGTAPSADIYRTTMAKATTYVDSAYFISKPYDIGGNYRLNNVKWTFIKHGAGTVVNPDDWALVRYRLASEAMQWTAWTPRIPEAGNMPLVPGTFTYSFLKVDGTPSPRSSPLWMPLINTTFRYIQFEVSLYKDSATMNLPEFTRFEIGYQDPPPEYPVIKIPEAFPVPADTDVTLRFKVIPDGAEVKVRLFNIAGEPVAEQNFVYGSGGDQAVTIPVSKFANGTYIALITATSIKDGKGGLLDGAERQTKARIKVVVRHRK